MAFRSVAGKPARWSAGLVVLVVASSMVAWSAAPAGAAVKPRLKLTAKPAVVAPAATLSVSGGVSGRLAGSARAYRVQLEERVGRRWTRRASGRLSGRKQFVTRWRVPGVERIRTLRVRLVRGRRVVATSARWRVSVVRPPVGPVPGGSPLGSGSPSPSPSPSPTPAAAPQTHVIAPGAVESAPAPGTGGTLRLSGTVALSPGDILASGIADAAPYGFLLKATGVRSDGGDTPVDVVPATLLEAVPEGQIDQSFSSVEAAGVRSGRASSRTRFRRALQCSAGGTVTIEGTADLGTPQYDIEADWGYFSLKSVKATASVTASANASATASGTASCTVGPVKLLDKKFVPITFSVGPVPVVLVPELEVQLDGLGQIDASVATSVDASLTATAGAEWADGALSPIAELSESFDYQPPDPQGAAKLAATLGSELELKFYGAGGPAFNFNAGLELNADPEAVPWWTLDAPVALTAGLEIDALDIELEPITVYEEVFRIAEAADGTWTGTITIAGTSSGPAYASEDGGTGTEDVTARSVLQIDRAPGTPDGVFEKRGVTLPEYAYSVSMTEPGLNRDWITGGECTYWGQGSSSAMTGGVSASINGSGVLGFGWGPEDGESPHGNWTFTESETCSPNGFGISDRDGVIYEGLGVCAHYDDHAFYQHYHAPLSGLVKTEGGKRVMRGSVTEACPTSDAAPTSGSATLTFDLVYGG